MGHPYDVERATDLHMEWCRVLMDRADLGTTHRAAPQMRAVMLELRDCLEPRAVVAIANVLPALERGIFLENWDLEYEVRPVTDAETFKERVYDRVKAHHARSETIVEDVFWVLNKMLEPSRAEVIRRSLPPLLLPLWPQQESGDLVSAEAKSNSDGGR